jgi:hypothetical protein
MFLNICVFVFFLILQIGVEGGWGWEWSVKGRKDNDISCGYFFFA